MKLGKYVLLCSVVLGTLNPIISLKTPQKVHATEVIEEKNVAPQTAVTINKENFGKYFVMNGSATYDQQSGELILTPDLETQAGAATSKTQLDMTKDFSISMAINLGTKPQSKSGGDGVAIGLYNDVPGKVGVGGNAFGLGGLNEAFGFKLDTVYNNMDEPYFYADPIEFDYLLQQDGAFAGFIHTENGNIKTVDNSGQEISAPDGNYRELTMSYQASTKDITVTYDGKTWGYNVASSFSSDNLSLIISAGTGLFCNEHSVIIHSFDGSLASKPVTINYVDENQTEIAPSDMIIDTLNAPYDVSGDAYKIAIPGYVLDTTKLPTNATGFFSDVDQVVTYVYKKDNSSLVVKDSSLYVGDSWQAQDNFVCGTDVDGNAISFDPGMVTESVDTAIAGIYPIHYQYNGITQIATVTVKARQTAVNVHDSTIYTGENWDAKDNFDAAQDKDGNPVDYSSVTVDASQVDVANPGVYDVTYTYDGITSTAKVTVKVNQTTVNVHDSTIYTGENWDAKDNFDDAQDKDGKSVGYSGITVDASQMDVTKPGVYDVTYTYAGVTRIAKVTVKANQTAVNVHDSTVYIGENWSAKDNFDSAIDKAGNSVSYSGVTVDASQVDVTKAGIYPVTYTYNGVTSTANVTVKAKQTAVNVHDSTIYVGEAWQAVDNFDSGQDKDGKALSFSQLTVDASQVDVTKAGIYDVTYTYDGVTSTAKVIVKAKQTAVNVHDSEIYVGDAWQAADNFDSGLDKDGKPLLFTDLTVEDSQMDSTKAGVYEVRYHYDGVTSTAKITVKSKQTAINVHDSTIYLGDAWQAKDNFDSALDKEGKPVDFSKLKVDSSQVNLQKPGVYEVIYSYDGYTSSAKITIKSKQTAINVHDSTIYVNEAWQAKDNFDSALDKDGKTVEFNQVTVDSSRVKLDKPGIYEVHYYYGGLVQDAKVTVKAKQTAVNVHDSTLYVGDKWNARDNFDNGLDEVGNPLAFSQLTVDDRHVNLQKVGVYEVTYHYGGVTSTAKITVKAKSEKVETNSDSSQPATSTKKETFPKTGEHREASITLAGLFAILLAMLIVAKKSTKKQEKNK